MKEKEMQDFLNLRDNKIGSILIKAAEEGILLYDLCWDEIVKAGKKYFDVIWPKVIKHHTGLYAPCILIFSHQQVQESGLSFPVPSDQAKLPVRIHGKARILKNRIIASLIRKGKVCHAYLCHHITSFLEFAAQKNLLLTEKQIIRTNEDLIYAERATSHRDSLRMNMIIRFGIQKTDLFRPISIAV